MFKSLKGFSLIELMIIVLIIGVLAAIAIPNFISMKHHADKEAVLISNMSKVQQAIDEFWYQNGHLPQKVDINQVEILFPGGGQSLFNPYTEGATQIHWVYPTVQKGAVSWDIPQETLAGEILVIIRNDEHYEIYGHNQEGRMNHILTPSDKPDDGSSIAG